MGQSTLVFRLHDIFFELKHNLSLYMWMERTLMNVTEQMTLSECIEMFFFLFSCFLPLFLL